MAGVQFTACVQFVALMKYYQGAWWEMESKNFMEKKSYMLCIFSFFLSFNQ